jgi:hypothetical protein
MGNCVLKVAVTSGFLETQVQENFGDERVNMLDKFQ